MTTKTEIEKVLKEAGHETWETADGHVRTDATIAVAQGLGLNAVHNAYYDNGENGIFTTLVFAEVPAKTEKPGPKETKDKQD